MGKLTKQEWIRVQRWGCELEVIGLTRQAAAEAVQSVVGGTVEHITTNATYDPWVVTDREGRKWQLVADGSLTDACFSERVELITPPLTMESMPLFQETVRALRRAKARKSRFGGIHVHVEGSNHTPQTIRNLVKIFNRLEKLIFMACGVQEDRLARYCKPNAEEFVKRLEAMRQPTDRNLNRAWFNGEYNPTPHKYHPMRYYAINLCNLWRDIHTVEFRFGEVPDGLHAGKIKAFIVLCLALSAAALTSRGACSRRKEFSGNPRFALRVGLNACGLTSPEFASVRKHLLANMPGNSAWKNPNQEREEHHETTPTV